MQWLPYAMAAVGGLLIWAVTYIVMRYKTEARDNYFLLEPLRRLRAERVFPYEKKGFYRTTGGTKIVFDQSPSGKQAITLSLEGYEDLHIYFNREGEVDRVIAGYGCDLRPESQRRPISDSKRLRYADRLTPKQVQLCLKILAALKNKCRSTSLEPVATPAA